MILRSSILLGLSALLIACTTEAPPVAPAETETIPKALFLTTKPASAESLAEAKSNAGVGDTVTFEARIGGRAEPFVDQRAVMVVIDPKLPPCSEGCPKPWDYCCESQESLVANTATVRFVDDQGHPHKTSIEKLHGLVPLANITVVGKVTEKDDGGQFVVDATGVFVAASTAGN